MTEPLVKNILCPCLTGEPYDSCCSPLHRQKEFAKTAEQLMRSRYSAFVLGITDYLINTLHHSKRKPDDHQQLQSTIKSTHWQGLSIISKSAGDEKDNIGEVEFVAFFQEQTIQQLHENSRFIKEDERWYYLDGDHLPPIKLKRNDPCFCGSGKKLKKCHPI